MFETLLNIYAPIAIAIFVIGVSIRMGRWAKAVVTPRRYHSGVNKAGFEGVAAPAGLLPSLKGVLVDPVTRFYMKANKTWGRGYVLYHMAIVTEVCGYALASLLLFGRILIGGGVPDVAAHAEHSFNYSPANLLAIVFGNGEHLQAQFLFGDFAPIFINVTWIAVGCAVLGNMHLMINLVRRRNGAVVSDIDQASEGLRTKGRRSPDRMLVRGLIFCIIWTELFARLGLFPGVVFVHAALGATLFMLLPFTYLFHIVYNFLAVFYATRRRMVRTVA